jgi:hypothetical protein
MQYKTQEQINNKLLNIILSHYSKSKEKKFFLLLWPDIFTIQLEFFNQLYSQKKTNNLKSNRLNNILREPGNKRNYFLRYFKHKIISKERYKPIFLMNDYDNISWLPDFIIDDYVVKNQIMINKTRKDEWFTKYKDNKSLILNKKLISLENDFLSIFTLFCKEFNIKLNSNLDILILESGRRLINWFYIQFKYLRKKPKINFFLSGTMGSPTNRLMADYVKDNQGKVIVFDHGASTGLWKNSYQANIESFMTDEFITYSAKMQKGLIINFRDKTHTFKKNNIHVDYARINFKIPTFKSRNKKFTNKFILVLATFDKNQITTNLYNDYLQFKWLKFLLKSFQSVNLDFCIKVHPNTSESQIENIKKISYAKIYSEDINNFDYSKNILIFDNPQSSSFRDSIFINCKVLLFKMPRMIFFNHVMPDLDMSCEIIEVKNIDNKFVFDVNNLKKSINKIENFEYDKSTLKKYFY